MSSRQHRHVLQRPVDVVDQAVNEASRYPDDLGQQGLMTSMQVFLDLFNGIGSFW